MEVDHDRAIVRAFFAPEKRARYPNLISTARGRKKFVAQFPHLDALDSRFVRRLDPREQYVDRIEALLKERGAPDPCYIVSENSRLDLQCMKLHDALRATVGFEMGTFLSCVAGQLAYIEGEEPGSRHICERAP
ncbi:MAG: hypothetical protein H0V83_05160 [Rubrobacter sp.]|nr:hypothetical protein [Rubrobacter sp.]